MRKSLINRFRLLMEAVERIALLAGDDDLHRFVRSIAEALRDAGDIDPVAVVTAIRNLPRGSAASPAKQERIRVDYQHASLSDVERIILDPETAKKEILEIAKRRFGVSIGAMQRLNREALQARMLAMIRDEQSHDAIARVASGDPGRVVSPRQPTDTNPEIQSPPMASSDPVRTISPQQPFDTNPEKRSPSDEMPPPDESRRS